MKPKYMGLGWTFVFIGAFSFLTAYNMLAHLELWELFTRFYTLEKVQLQSLFLIIVGLITFVVTANPKSAEFWVKLHFHIIPMVMSWKEWIAVQWALG